MRLRDLILSVLLAAAIHPAAAQTAMPSAAQGSVLPGLAPKKDDPEIEAIKKKMAGYRGIVDKKCATQPDPADCRKDALRKIEFLERRELRKLSMERAEAEDRKQQAQAAVARCQKVEDEDDKKVCMTRVARTFGKIEGVTTATK